MPPTEWSWRRAGVQILGVGVAGLVALPAYLGISPAWRPTAVRLACAVLAALACGRVVRWARREIGAPPPSALDAPPAPPAPLALDGRFATLRDDVAASARSRRYFDVILWPRLAELADGDLAAPPARPGLRRRGPSLREMERLVAEIERRG